MLTQIKTQRMKLLWTKAKKLRANFFFSFICMLIKNDNENDERERVRKRLLRNKVQSIVCNERRKRQWVSPNCPVFQSVWFVLGCVCRSSLFYYNFSFGLIWFGLPIFFFFRVHIATAASAATYMIIYISTHTSEWGAGAKCTFIWFDLISFNLTFHYFWSINTSNCRCYYYHYHLFISRSFSLFLPFSTILGIWHAAAQLWLVQTF